jgi:hypothetical protein
MAECPVNKIDSNIVGLAIAEEVCPGILPGETADFPGTPVWQNYEPNSYSDFGGELTTVARNPINQSRQNQKGLVTDIEASGGFNHDFMLSLIPRRLQEFFFADMREKATTRSLNKSPTPITAVASATGYAVSGATTLGFAVGQLLLAYGFDVASNNGLKVVSAASATAVNITPAGSTEASPPVTAGLKAVGFQFPADDVALQAPVGDLPRLVATATNLTNLGLLPGEWIFIGGDAIANQFDGGNFGFARVKSVSATTIILDKVDWAVTAQAGTGKSLQIFYGDVLKNESDPTLIKARSVQLRRTLGRDANGIQSEYLIGSYANELTLNMPLADKINVDLGYTSMDHVTRTGTQGLKAGTNLPVARSDVFNTSSDFARIKLAIINATNGNPTPLFSFVNEMTLTIGNGITMNKALGVLGAIGQSSGNFAVGGSLTAYFSTVAAVQAVRNNADVTLDMISVKKNTGMVWDIPLLTLGGGRVTVEQDQPVMIPLDSNAAESAFGHTLMFGNFAYLPNLAQ